MSKNGTLMMIGGGIQEIKAIEIAKAAGFKVLVTDRDMKAPCFPYADYTATFDGRDIEGLTAYVLLNKNKLNIVGVFTLTELVTSVAAVAAACDLPGVSLKSAVSCQNKQLSKQIWQQHSVPTPKGEVIYSAKEAKIFLHGVDGKAFIKPVVGFGGIGARPIESDKDIDKVFDSQIPRDMMIEEYVEGSMHDVNGVFDYKGEFTPLGCFDRFFQENAPIESGAVYPSQLDNELVNEAYELTRRAAIALGIIWGPVKSDLVLTRQGFQILEISTRLHGPKGTLGLTSMVEQPSHLERILDVIAKPNGTTCKINKASGVAAYEIIDHPGKMLSRIKGIDILQSKGFELLRLNNSPSRIMYKDNSDVIGYIFGKGKEANQLRRDLRRAKKELSFD